MDEACRVVSTLLSAISFRYSLRYIDAGADTSHRFRFIFLRVEPACLGRADELPVYRYGFGSVYHCIIIAFAVRKVGRAYRRPPCDSFAFSVRIPIKPP